MAKSMTPSVVKGITRGEAGKMCDNLSARCMNNADVLPSAIVQDILKDSSEADAVAHEQYLVIRRHVEARMTLTSPQAVEVTLLGPHDPNTFFADRVGLWVSSDFRSRVVANAKATEVGARYKVVRRDLVKNLTDEKIEAGLPVKHNFDETKVCGLIAGLIARQPNGEEGELLNNGFSNLFYTASCVVSVRWRAGVRWWSVDAWRRYGSGWLAGRRVFSLGN